MSTTVAELDGYARDYYLGRTAADLDLEERQQQLSLARLAPFLHGSILELGFGTGQMTAGLLEAGLETAVVEGSPLLAEEARRRHPGLTVHEGMFESFTPPHPVDTLLAAHVFEHVDDPRALLEHLRGWLRPGGTLIAIVPNAASLHRRLAVLMGIQDKLDDLSPRDRVVGHRRVYTLEELRADLAGAGFKTHEAIGWFLKVVPNGMMLDWPPQLIDALFAVSEQLDPRELANIALVARRGA